MHTPIIIILQVTNKSLISSQKIVPYGSLMYVFIGIRISCNLCVASGKNFEVENFHGIMDLVL